MRRSLLAGLAGLALLLTLTTSAVGLVAVMILPVPQRAAQSEVVIAGKVTALEPKTIRAERFPGDKQMGEFQVAIVKIDEAFIGAKGLTHIKVGFVPQPVVVPPAEDRPIKIRPIRPRPGFNQPKLEKGQEALLFLRAHHKEGFYLINPVQGVVDKKANEYKQELAEVKKIGKVLADPVASLKSKDAGERFQAAALLLFRYKSPQAGQTKEEAIPAEESKLILQALAEANWDAPRTGRTVMHPAVIFQYLRLQPKDGWKPTDFRQLNTAAKEWLKANANSYRVTRYVSGTTDK